MVTASLSRCDTNFRCTYSFSGTGATPSGDLELVIVNGAGVDIQSLPDFSYPTGYSATSDGTFSATNFATTLGEPDVHEFRFRDVATGRVASASIRFAHPAPLEVLQASSSRSRCPHDPGCSYELSVRGLTPRGAVQLRIRDGNGVDINTLPGYRYPIDWTANDSGTLATGTFQTGTAGPDTHTFEFVDVATGSRTTTALVFE